MTFVFGQANESRTVQFGIKCKPGVTPNVRLGQQ